ncbi:Protein of unknown function [Gryllus bimaculatus]|nr:Protein of unknown function [Gryllus bimaculatus]
MKKEKQNFRFQIQKNKMVAGDRIAELNRKHREAERQERVIQELLRTLHEKLERIQQSLRNQLNLLRATLDNFPGDEEEQQDDEGA